MELKSWTKLKMLDLSCTDNIRKIPQHLICSFSKLQIFRMWFRMYLIDYPNEDNVLKRGNEKLIAWKKKGLLSVAMMSLCHANDFEMLSNAMKFKSWRVKLLSLEGCSLLTTEGLEAVILSWQDLENLIVVSCKNINESDISPALATLFSILKELFLQLHLDPASSNTLPTSGNGSITQSMKVTNSQHGKKSLVMRIRIAYKINNKDVVEEGQVSNFPRDL
ncbi:hypothetical protein GOBAR_DD04325 [Gossypium barbadense]|nr:hypothetical protein GOBAR_DD04325 [Gossypium barbadense]